MIWTDIETASIVRSNADGSNIETLLSRQRPIDVIAVESEQKVYWTESGENALWRVGLNSNVPELVYKGKDKLQGLTFAQNKLYLIQGSSILKMNTDGTQVETVITLATDALDVVVIEGQVYWSTAQNSKIFKQNANGRGGVAVFSDLASAKNLLYNAVDKQLYWQEYCGATFCSGIRKGNPNGTNKVNVIDLSIGGFAFSSDGSKIYANTIVSPQIFSINLDGTERTRIASTSISPSVLVVLNNQFFWLDFGFGDYLYKSDLNGANQKVVATTSVFQPRRFVIDTIEKWIYWANSHSSFDEDKSSATSIRRAKLDGSQKQIIIPSTSVSRPAGLALDLNTKKLYWADRGNAGIFRSNLDGTNIEKIVSTGSSVNDIAIDADRGYLFWPEGGTKKLMRSNLNGSQVKTLAEKLGTPYGLALDKKRGYVYFSERDYPRVKRVPIDSGKVDTIMIRPNAFDRVEGLSIDNSKGHLYWTDDGVRAIYRANLDGSNITQILSQTNGLRSPAGIQIFNSSFIVGTKNWIKPNTLKIYPNPFGSSFQVEGLKTGDQVELYDQLGRRTWQQKITLDGNTRVTCAGFPAGMYYLSVRHTNGQVSVEKLYKHSDE